MILSKSCIYGIRAAMYIATQEGRKFIPIKEVSEKLDISFHFLTKILQELTKSEIMVSYRGPSGGIGLARPAEQITLYNIVEVLECSGIFTDCILGLPGCGQLTPCPLHEKWGKSREEVKSIFTQTTLAELSRDITRLNLRLTGNDPGCEVKPKNNFKFY